MYLSQITIAVTREHCGIYALWKTQ